MYLLYLLPLQGKGCVVIHTDMEQDIQKIRNSSAEYFLYHPGNPVPAIPDHSDLFTEIVYIPLRKITHATEQYAAGNMHYEFQVDSEDEIGYLASCLNYMASEIARSRMIISY